MIQSIDLAKAAKQEDFGVCVYIYYTTEKGTKSTLFILGLYNGKFMLPFVARLPMPPLHIQCLQPSQMLGELIIVFR